MYTPTLLSFKPQKCCEIWQKIIYEIHQKVETKEKQELDKLSLKLMPSDRNTLFDLAFAIIKE